MRKVEQVLDKTSWEKTKQEASRLMAMGVSVPIPELGPGT